MEQQQYHYEALPGDGGSHIRIATIHPAQRFEDEIYVSLRVEEFQVINESHPDDRDNIPSYEAMSYCWGAPGNDGHVLVRRESGSAEWQSNDRSQVCWLPARANLLSALRHLRHETEPRDMWIDAICIDQEDVIQKGPQVALMGTLYSRAASVLVWLGPADNGSDRVMELLQDWGTQWTFSIWTGHHPTDSRMLADKDVPLNCSGADSLAVYHFFCRDWFERIWVRQEIGLANTSTARVQCGTAVMSWSDFRNAWGALHNKHTSDEDAAFKTKLEDRLDQLYGLLSQAPEIWLTWVRDTCVDAKCFDPRDRIYAMRSLLVDDAVKKAIQPDYTMTTVEVYRHAALAFLSHDSDGDLIILEECRLHSGWEGPSWVPDWSHSVRTIVALGKKRATGNVLPRSKVWELVAPDVLRICGVVVDEVVNVCSVSSLKDIQDMLAGDPRGMDAPYPVGGTVLEAYARALCDDRFTHNDLSARGSRRPVSAMVQNQLLQLLHSGQTGTEAEMETPAWAWIRRMLTNRVLLRTASGLVGLAENVAGCFQSGDQVFAIFGCKHLLVLRPVRCGDNEHLFYQLRGYCHIEGANFGEAVLGPLPPHICPVLAELTFPDGKRLNWVFQDTRTGEVIREDPRLASLGFDMGQYRSDLERDSLPWLRVDLDMLKQRLTAREVCVQTLDLI